MSVKKVLVSNVFGKYNLGDLALYNELLSKLEGHEISTVIRFPTEQEGVTELEPIGKELSRNPLVKLLKQLTAHFFAYLYFKKVRPARYMLRPEKRKTLKAIAECDFMISCPGGFLEDSNNSYYVSTFQLLFGVWAGKKVIIAPQSIGPVKSDLGRRFLRYTLKRCRMVFAREDVSLDFIKNTLDLTNYEYSPDIILNSKTLDRHKKEAKKKDIVYATVVNWGFPHLENPKAYRENYKNELIRLFKYLNEQYGQQVTILNQVDSDLPIADEIVAEVPDIVSIDREKHSPQMMIDKISTTRVFVGTRFHSCIFSYLAQIPFVAISYLPKTTGMLSALGIEGRHVDIDKVTFEGLRHMIEEVLNTDVEDVQQEFQRIKERIDSDDVFSKYVNELLVEE
ncbi:MAG: hypothetical protein Roseis2KO_22110 [Roseivirga sp.]